MPAVKQRGAVRPQPQREHLGKPDSPAIGAAESHAIAEADRLQQQPVVRRDQEQADEQGHENEADPVGAAAEAIGEHRPEEAADQRPGAGHRDDRTHLGRGEAAVVLQVDGDEAREQLVAGEVQPRQEDAGKRDTAPLTRQHLRPTARSLLRRVARAVSDEAAIVGNDQEHQRRQQQRHRAQPQHPQPFLLAQRPAQQADHDLRQREHRRIDRGELGALVRRKQCDGQVDPGDIVSAQAQRQQRADPQQAGHRPRQRHRRREDADPEGDPGKAVAPAEPRQHRRGDQRADRHEDVADDRDVRRAPAGRY